ncbi:MAG: hypothetical protein JSS20_10345 [Proteobacteria bacterium]|nr:hypothetical protein [Pseudomonadota bacterium]
MSLKARIDRIERISRVGGGVNLAEINARLDAARDRILAPALDDEDTARAVQAFNAFRASLERQPRESRAIAVGFIDAMSPRDWLL